MIHLERGHKFYSQDYWIEEGVWCADWLINQPDYWSPMIQSLLKDWFFWVDQDSIEFFFETDSGKNQMRDQLFLRLSQASTTFIPWIEQKLNLKGLKILEIGCGTGSSTVSMSRAGAFVTGVDYAESSIKLNEKRHHLLGLSAKLKLVSESWLRGGENSDIFNEKYDLIVCYALIEHLSISERVHLLSLIANKIKSDHSLFIIYETPNRLPPWDWHSTKIQFPDVVPDELALLYLQKRLPENHSWRSKINNFFTTEGWLDWQRQGRGCSYHEFDVTFGLENIEIYLDGYDSPDKFDYQRHQNPDLNFEKALHEFFSKNKPPIPKGFARPSLDLIIKSL